MTELLGPNSVLPPAPDKGTSSASAPPPHPLEGSWLVSIEGKNYGPYTGYELRDYAKDGRITEDTQVARLGGTSWKAAKDDPALRQFFERTSIIAADRSGTSSRVSAADGATIVQVTNNIGPQLGFDVAGDLFEGVSGYKSPGIALILSILICGLGQLYNGQIAKGILMFVLMVISWVVFLGWVIWIWSAIDAYTTAKAMNLRNHMRLTGAVPTSPRG
jgi:TM2 domain-containing membrane protein YozV